MIDFRTILSGIVQAAPVLAKAPALGQLLEDVVDGFDGQDQAKLKEALADARADNDEGHRRLQEKLRAAQG